MSFKNPKNRIVLASLALLIVFAVDLFSPLGIATGILYLLCFLVIGSQTEKTIIFFTVIITFLVMLKIILFYTSETSYFVYLNRSLTILSVYLTAFLSAKYYNSIRKTQEEREKYIKHLKKKKDELTKLRIAIDTYLFFTISDCKGNIVYVNKQYCAYTKYKRKELIGQNHRIFNSGFHSPEFFTNLWKTVSSGRVWHNEVRNKTKDGVCFWSDTTVFPVFDNCNKIIQYFCLRIPIDERKNQERERTEYSNALEQMIFMISHKVRQPIAHLLGINELIDNTKLSQVELKKVLDFTKQSVLSLDNLTRELNDFLHNQELRINRKTVTK